MLLRWLALTTFSLSDFITTKILLGNGGGEANPIMRYVMALTGSSWGILIPKCFSLMLLAISYWLLSKYDQTELLKRYTVILNVVIVAQGLIALYGLCIIGYAKFFI